MARAREWRCDIYRDLGGEVHLSLMEASEEGQWSMIDAERFAGTTTATECLQWLVRHWAPRAGLPLR